MHIERISNKNSTMLSRYSPRVYVRCDLCGNDNATPIAHGERFGIEITVVICRTCGLVYQNPRLSEKELEAFYQDEYRGLYSGSNEVPLPEFIQQQLKRGREILRFCRPYLKDKGLVLDVGAGCGGVLIPFRDQGYQVYGVEPGPYGKWGAENLGLNMYVCTFESLPQDNICPDLIIFSFVLEHVPSPRTQLAKAYTLLAPEGIIFVEVPNLRQISAPVEQYFHIAHMTYFTPATLRAALENSGFAVVKMEDKCEYSFRVLAVKKPALQVGTQANWSMVGDNPQEIEALLQWHNKVSKAKAILRPIVRACESIVSKLFGEKVASKMVQIYRQLWVRIWSITNFVGIVYRFLR